MTCTTHHYVCPIDCREAEIDRLRAEVEALRAALEAVQRYPGIAKYLGAQIMSMIKEALK